MKYSHLQFEISKLQGEMLQKTVESIAVFVFSLFTAIFLPQLIFNFFYSDQMLTQEPAVLTYIPVASFALGVAYFVFSLVMNIGKGAKIRRLQMDLSDVGGCDCLGDSDLEEVQSIVDEILAEAEDKPAKKVAKKSTKTATAKKTTAKKKNTSKKK